MEQKQESTISKPKASSEFAQKELDKAEKQFETFDSQLKSLTLDRMNQAPKLEEEPQTKISTREAQKYDAPYLKPKRSISCREPFNEKYRGEWNFAKECVKFIAEHKELIGETISDIWTKPFAGIPAESWDVPVNKPVWGPRHLAEQIRASSYHRLVMDDDRRTGTDGHATFTGGMVIDRTIQRLDANPVSDRKSVFMGASGF